MNLRSPHYFLWGNLVFGRGPDDAWAAYRLEGESYPGLSLSRKLELKDRIAAFAYNVEADFQLIRSSREWNLDEYRERALATLEPRRGHGADFEQLLADHRELFRSRRLLRPETYLLVRIGGPANEVGAARLLELRNRLELLLGLNEAHGIGRRQLAELRTAEGRCHERALDYLPCERARSGEIARLIRGAYVRGLGEPQVDPNWRPQALVVEDLNGGGEASFEPYEHDLLRLHESRLTVTSRSLRVESELGTSRQALLVLGALPEEASFPGADAELLFAPLELDFPVDAVLSCEYLANRSAQRLAQKRMVDADQQAKEEGYGEHGSSVRTAEKTQSARELQARLGGSDRPPLLRSAVTLAIGADTEEELEQRIERLRSEYGRIELHRPYGEQHRLFLGAMPAQPFPVPDYKAHLLPEQVGAMVPTAISYAGSEIGPYIGHALSGSRAPVLLDLAEACKLNRPPTILLTGSLGSGKTIALQTLLYQSYLQGSHPIVDIDPKGDHRLERLPGVKDDSIEVIELQGSESQRGILDPLRIGDAAGREELAYGFLAAILPQPVPAGWQTKIRAAIGGVCATDGNSIGEVLEALRSGDRVAKQAAEALEVHLGSGLARLGCAEAGQGVSEVGAAQLVSIRIRGLVRPEPGTARSELQDDERVSQAIVRLLAAYALRLCAASERTHAVLALDEAWALLADSQGRAMLERFSRMGRSMNITPLLASQIVGDATELEPLVGAYLAFGVEREAEAERALRLLRLDPDDAAAQQRLIGFRAGRCIYLDHHGRTLPMRFEPGAEILAALDTTPAREPAQLGRRGSAAESDPADGDAAA